MNATTEPTPVARLQAAIAKLDRASAEYWASDEGGQPGRSSIAAANPGGGRVVAVHVDDDDARLIATLHRTIDAQLRILRNELARCQSRIADGGIERLVWSSARDVLALADAILEETH